MATKDDDLQQNEQEQGQNGQNEDKGQEIDILNLSDEEFAKLDPNQLASAPADAGQQQKTAEEEQAAAAAETKNGQGEDENTDPEAKKQPDDAGAAGKASADPENPGQKAAASEEEAAAAANGKQSAKVDPAKAGEATKEDGKSDKTGQEAQKSAGEIDYKAAYDKLLTPFKANGREMKVENIDEAIQLMQMGANYNKKMAALKPNLALLKMLENSKLLDADKISFLIDLHNKVPEAINKLVKDSGIDPMDLSADKAGEYRPGNHAVNPTEVELDTVLDDLKESPKFNQVLQVATNWDQKSKQIIAQHPDVLRAINDHMNSGVYDLISTEMNRRAALGRLQGLSDIEAYRQVGDDMAASGKFAHLGAGQPAPNQGQQAAAAPVVVPPKPKQADDSNRDDKRRAASPVKAAAPAAKLPVDFNPLAMSDAEFAKLNPKFQ